MVLGHAPYSGGHHAGRFPYNLMKIEYFSHAAISAATTGLGFPATCVGTNLAYRKSVYTGLGGFGPMRHIHSGDDDLFLQRVRDETGWQIRYAFDPGSFVPNAPPHTWKQFYNQRLRYASKGFMYPFRFTLILSGYYLYNLFLLFVLISAAFGTAMLTLAILTCAVKLIAEYLFLRTASSVFRYPLPVALIPLAGLLHIPYVIYFGLMANFRRFEWGGLRQRAGV
jgi:cellulose synthase/poly-beta-1,6-N-acetylglucosamine synthase-like glycosyltransferase